MGRGSVGEEIERFGLEGVLLDVEEELERPEGLSIVEVHYHDSRGHQIKLRRAPTELPTFRAPLS